ncbi:MAG: hypothetical protein K6G32_14415 [Prevotella sp.]|nr:hypothetical protein [Prevotella sp.]
MEETRKMERNNSLIIHQEAFLSMESVFLVLHGFKSIAPKWQDDALYSQNAVPLAICW